MTNTSKKDLSSENNKKNPKTKIGEEINEKEILEKQEMYILPCSPIERQPIVLVKGKDSCVYDINCSVA